MASGKSSDSGCDAATALELRRTSEGFVASAEALPDVNLGPDFIRQCEYLESLFHGCDEGACTRLDVKRQSVVNLLRFIPQAHSEKLFDVQELIGIILAADFLQADAALRPACRQLASLAFPLHLETGNKVDSSPTDSCKGPGLPTASYHAIQVVECLSEELAVLTMRAALTSTAHTRRPQAYGRTFDSYEACLDQDPMCLQGRLLALMSLLPEHSRHLAIFAHRDVLALKGPDHRAFTLQLPDLCAAGPITAALALITPSNVTSLTLEACSWKHHPSSADAATHDDAASPTSTVPHVIAPLSSLTALMHLSVEVHSGEGDRSWVQVFHAAVSDVLMALTRLSSLCVRFEETHGSRGTLAPLNALIPGLLCLTGLRALDVRNHALDCRGVDGYDTVATLVQDDSFKPLAQMTGLSSLCLQGCQVVGSSHVFELIRSMCFPDFPLVYLDLRGVKCPQSNDGMLEVARAKKPAVQADMLDESAPSEASDAGEVHRNVAVSGPDVPQLKPFSELLCLCIEVDPYGEQDEFDHLLFPSALTELRVDCMGRTMQSNAHRKLLQSINCPDLQVLCLPGAGLPDEAYTEPPFCGELGNRLVQAEASEICQVLQRCPKLCKVALYSLYWTRLHVIMHSIALLPHLTELRLWVLVDPAGRRDVFVPFGHSEDQEPIDEVQAIVQASRSLSQCVGLTRLSLDSNAVPMLSMLVMNQLTNLSSLQWRSNNTWLEYCVLTDQAVRGMLGMKNLTSLELIEVSFTDAAVAELAKVLVSMPMLQDMRLQDYVGRTISEEWVVDDTTEPREMRAVLEVLPGLESLRSLMLLPTDRLSGADVDGLVAVIPKMQSLREVFLRFEGNVPDAVWGALKAAPSPGVELKLW